MPALSHNLDNAISRHIHNRKKMMKLRQKTKGPDKKKIFKRITVDIFLSIIFFISVSHNSRKFHLT